MLEGDLFSCAGNKDWPSVARTGSKKHSSGETLGARVPKFQVEAGDLLDPSLNS